MRTLVCLICLLPAAAVPQGLTRGERDRAMSELHATRKQLLDAVEGLSAAQWTFKPSDSAWSIAETAEHLAMSEDALFEMVTRKLMAAPPQPERKAEVKGKDEIVLKTIADRSTRVKAPASLTPKGRSPEAVVKHFRESRDRTIAYIETTPGDLRSHISEGGGMGPLDAYQYILFISAHTARHLEQIREVQADPRYPPR
jgi:uncharacterized damage-inducible protein DinB